MLEHRRMLRRLLPVLVTVSVGAIALGGCNRTTGTGPAFPQPIRDEKEPGESVDTLGAVPDTSSSSVEEMTGSSSETEIEIDEDSSAADDGDKDSEKSADADKSGDEAGGDDEGGDDETGDEPDEPGDLGRDADSAIRP
jgi:hypothetical protein